MGKRTTHRALCPDCARNPQTRYADFSGFFDALPQFGREHPLMGGTGLYVGWDGRWVKIGIAAGKGGVRERRHLYVTHNPHFRVVAIVPCEPSRVRDMEFRLLQRLGPHAAHKRFDRGPGHVEWFLPTAEVVAEVSSLLAASAAATARAMNAASSFLARPRGAS